MHDGEEAEVGYGADVDRFGDEKDIACGQIKFRDRTWGL